LDAYWEHEVRGGGATVSAAGSGGRSPPVREAGTGTVPEPAGGTPVLRAFMEMASATADLPKKCQDLAIDGKRAVGQPLHY